MTIQIRTMNRGDWQNVADLIFRSTNAWYQQQGRPPIFTCDVGELELFCRVYEALDPGCCLLACDSDGRPVGSCFFHPRPRHYSLGIMNVDPRHFGRGIAAGLLREITDRADRDGLPVRLVSSAVNLDSFSLYNRAGFVPTQLFQDMVLQVPAEGIQDPEVQVSGIRAATPADVQKMVQLEEQCCGIVRAQDFAFFVANDEGIWNVSVVENDGGELDGFLVSVRHPASNMLGPGVAHSQTTMTGLILHQLNQQRGRMPVWLVPTDATEIVARMYRWGARNCELHISQVRGHQAPPSGISLPTFMPETG